MAAPSIAFSFLDQLTHAYTPPWHIDSCEKRTLSLTSMKNTLDTTDLIFPFSTYRHHLTTSGSTTTINTLLHTMYTNVGLPCIVTAASPKGLFLTGFC